MRLQTNRAGIAAPRIILLAMAIALVGTGLTMLASPAHAVVTEDVTNPISEYYPNGIRSTVYKDNISNFTFQDMIWDNAARVYSLRVCDNYCPGYEHETDFYTGPSQCWPGAYSGSWGSDLPNAYLDTDFLDPPDFASRAGGSAFSTPLATGRWYYHWLRMDGICQDGYPYKIKSQDSYFDPFAFRCTGQPSSYQWCVYNRPNSPRDWIPIAAGWTTGPTTRIAGYNQLSNRSFESGFASWATQGTASYSVYGGGAKEDNLFVEFNCRNLQVNCSILQDVNFSVASNHLFTAEVGLRCNSSTACPVVLVLWGLGVTADEGAVRYLTVPPGVGSWSVYGLKAKTYAPHSKLRLEVYNSSFARNLDVDFTTLHWSDTRDP